MAAGPAGRRRPRGEGVATAWRFHGRFLQLGCSVFLQLAAPAGRRRRVGVCVCVCVNNSSAAPAGRRRPRGEGVGQRHGAVEGAHLRAPAFVNALFLFYIVL